MTISTEQYSIKALFEQKQTFAVPKYQRGYAWEDQAIGDFLSDIRECLDARRSGGERHHFFGGVVTIRRDVSNSTRDNYEVIDGQQRLASFVMLAGCIVAAINQVLEALESSEGMSDEDKKAKRYFEETVGKLERLYLVFRDNKGIEYSDVNKLTLSKADNEFFYDLLSGQCHPDCKRESHKRMVYAHKAISTFVNDYLFPEDVPVRYRAERVQEFFDKVLGSDCTAIFMCSDERSEAYQIFQVLNDRGVHLGAGDLLRARTLELMDDGKLEQTQDKVADQWDDVLAYAPKAIDENLLWYFSSMEGRRPKPVQLAEDYLDYRFQCKDKEQVTTAGADKILSEVDQLREGSRTLEVLRDGSWPYYDGSNVSNWDKERLRMLVCHLDHTNAMPLLLSMRLLPAATFADAVASIERFVFRYKTIVNAHATPMTNIYLKHASEIRKSTSWSITQLRSDLSELIDKYASDSIFETAIREMKFAPKRSNRHIRYFLVTLEDFKRWYDSGAEGRPKCKDKTRVFDLNKITLEHIYPQNAAEGDEHPELEEVKHEIGNLTILGPEDNNALANKDFDEKLAAFSASNLVLNRELAEHGDWNKQHVKSRTENLAEAALKIFVP